MFGIANSEIFFLVNSFNNVKVIIQRQLIVGRADAVVTVRAVLVAAVRDLELELRQVFASILNPSPQTRRGDRGVPRTIAHVLTQSLYNYKNHESAGKSYGLRI